MYFMGDLFNFGGNGITHAQYFNYMEIPKARKLNSRNKAQKRGFACAGGYEHIINIHHVGGTLINPDHDIKRNCNWKARKKQIKHIKVAVRKAGN